MYRPWWFPEFNPQQQYTFDKIIEILTHIFQQHNFSHIWTPAVEPIEILKKGWDVVDKQVFGLYWLAQWVEDVKDYALHFDLTVPLARYILDHRQDLTFPFKRFQMQPVWRGERTQRGRFKEFWQFDVDVIWPSASNVWVWYDIETVAVLSKAMDAVCNKFNVKMDRVLKISHLGLTKSFLQSFDLDPESLDKILGLLDGYFKITPEAFAEKLNAIAPKEVSEKIYKLIESKDHSMLSAYNWYADLKAILDGLKQLGVPYEYDICIVRWHNYYKGMVCEWFEKTDIAVGSLAAGGRYDNITDFIDPKQSFSWVGTSLGRFVYLAVERITDVERPDSYLFVNFEETYEDVLKLYNSFLADGKVCDMYPTAAKIGKQLEYANKKWISHVVILGPWEKDQWIYKIKNLVSGEENEISLW